MRTIKTITLATLVVALTLVALPAAAQGRAREREDRGRAAQQVGRAPENARPQAARPMPRQESRAFEPRDYGRQQAAPRYNPPPQQYRGDVGRTHVAPRGYSAPRGYVAPRGYIAPRGYVGPRGYVAPRGYLAPRVYVAPRIYRPFYFARPYYAFRPRLSIGFGLWLGFPVQYPRAWIAYPPVVYGYYNGGIGVVPGVTAYGGVSFDIAPRDAAIFLDGTFIGYAGDFAPNAAPLTLTPGAHRIEVQADGYQPMSWDVDIIPGQVIPFRGDMQPY